LKFLEKIIAEEAGGAAKIKTKMPIMVVLGNPPYSGHSANRSWEVRDGKKVPTFMGKLLQDYYEKSTNMMVLFALIGE